MISRCKSPKLDLEISGCQIGRSKRAPRLTCETFHDLSPHVTGPEKQRCKQPGVAPPRRSTEIQSDQIRQRPGRISTLRWCFLHVLMSQQNKLQGGGNQTHHFYKQLMLELKTLNDGVYSNKLNSRVRRDGQGSPEVQPRR